jgi:hypothetical protein
MAALLYRKPASASCHRCAAHVRYKEYAKIIAFGLIYIQKIS